jgi:hypothetical protein
MARMPTIQGDDFLQTYQLQRALMRERQGGGKADWAKALMQRGASTAPVQSPLEGLARMLTAGVGGYYANQARTEGEASEQEMLARMIGQNEQRKADETAQLAQAGVPGFQMPMPQPVPGQAMQVPVAPAGGGDVVMPPGMPTPPAQPPARPVNAELIAALSNLAGQGNQTAANVLPVMQFQYQDSERKAAEARAEARAQQQLAMSAANANRETFGAPVAMAGPDGRPVLVQVGNRGTMRPVEGFQPLVDPPKPQTPTEAQRAALAAGLEPGTPEYQRYMRAALDKTVAPPAPAAVVTMGDGGLGRELAKGTATEVAKAREGAIAAERSIESANRIVEALDSGAITGIGAEFRQNAARVLASIGLIDGKVVANTQMLLSELSKNVLAQASQMTGVLTDKDIEFLKDAAAGRIAMTETTLRRAAELAARGQMRIIERYNTLVTPMQQDENLPAMTRRLYAPMTPPAFRGAAPPPPPAGGTVGAASPSTAPAPGDPLGILR